MVRNDIPLIERLPAKTGMIRKILCCNCLSEDRVIHPILGWKYCRSCGAKNDPIIILWISVQPDPTGHEL